MVDFNNGLSVANSVTTDEVLISSVSQVQHIGTVVKAFVYDTSKDNDGGAWRKKTQSASWYTETLGGNRWTGRFASVDLAWSAAGNSNGAVFQASATAGALTSGKFYTATSSTTATEVVRGISKEFQLLLCLFLSLGV